MDLPGIPAPLIPKCDAHLRKPVSSRKPWRKRIIKVYTQAPARQILFDANNNERAPSVIVTTAGKNLTLSANPEIILSAGTFQYPQLFMISGIGPEATWHAHGIPVVRHLPGVVQNLWDQPLFGMSYRVNLPTASFVVNSPPCLRRRRSSSAIHPE